MARGPFSPNRGLPTWAVSCADSEQFLEERHAGRVFGKCLARNWNRPTVPELCAWRRPFPTPGTLLVAGLAGLAFLAREAPEAYLRPEWAWVPNVSHRGKSERLRTVVQTPP